MKPFFFGSNFKMHQTPEQTACFVRDLQELLSPAIQAQLFLIPPYTSLATAHKSLGKGSIWLGAQNMHWADEGAYTGEISPTMLRACGVDLIMLGHAERRSQFGETDGVLRKKVNAAVRHDLRILLCVGENAEQRQSGQAQATIASQIQIALADFDETYLPKLMIAYEPVWSIGKGGKPADPKIVFDMHAYGREILVELFGAVANAIPILYGGSVNPSNCAPYAALPEVDGLFVGRAAWSPGGFVDVLTRALEARA